MPIASADPLSVVHVIRSIEEAASGTSTAVTALNGALSTVGVRSRIVATRSGAAVADSGSQAETYPRKRFLLRLGRSPRMHRELRRQASAGAISILHSHGLWTMPNLYPAWVAATTGIPLVVSPHGMLSLRALERSRTVKAIFWNVAQRRAMARAALLHATSEGEVEDIRRQGFRQPVMLIPNGVDLPPSPPSPRTGPRTLLYLGRVHPIKGLDLLLEAWGGLHAAFPDWQLKITGPDDVGHLAELQALATQLKLDRVAFAGPVFGEERLAAYREASVFVLPTRSENFGMVVAEALACGCPVVTTKGAPWSGLVDHHAGWWTAVSAASLREALGEAMRLPRPELAAMGRRGRAWMERDFQWTAVASRMMEAYRWILYGGSLPSCVVMD